MEIGKWAITLFILRKEISNNLFAFENQDKGCYRYLASKLDASWDALKDNKVSFVTFNYDRSLEHFLLTTFQNSYGKSETDSAEMVDQLSIIHVHGSLGKLPWQTGGGLSYGASMDYYKEHRSGVANGAANTASKQIKVIPENQSTSDEFENAYNLLSNAIPSPKMS